MTIHVYLKYGDFSNLFSETISEAEWSKKDNPLTTAYYRQAGYPCYLLDKYTFWVFINRKCYVYKIENFDEQMARIRTALMTAQPCPPFVMEYVGMRQLEQEKEGVNLNGTAALP